MYKCKICGKKYNELTALYNHLENKHKEMIPKNMTVQQFYYYMKTGKSHGNCVMCKQPTSWNMNTGKYNRFCGNPKCKDEYVKIMKDRMIAKYGKTHLLNDPNKQREMLSKRKISGVYTWEDNEHETTYTGSYELDFLKTLDIFFNWDPEDISMPSPHTYTYKYEGEEKFYIPDVFIHSLDLEIEIKDGGDNPNMHYKIQEVDKEKERLKDEVLRSQKIFHYIKITNKNYQNFFDFLSEVKKGFEKYGDEKKIPRIFKIEDIKGSNIKHIQESFEILEEGFIDKVNKSIIKFNEFNNVKYKDRDLFFSLQYDLVKNDPKRLQEYLTKMVKAAKFEEDIYYIEKMVRKTIAYYNLQLKKHPELKDMYGIYYDWIKSGGLDKEIKERKKDGFKIKESFDIIEESYIINTMKESSISIPQISYYLQNEYEEEMKKYLNTYKKYYNLMLEEQPAAVKNINEDIKKALIVIDGLASKGVENNLVQFAKDDLGEIVKAAKHGKPVKVIESMVEDMVNIDDSTNDINSITVNGSDVSISNDVIDVKLVYENDCERLFTLSDTNSKLIIENHYVVQRDKIGTHCSISPLYNNIKEPNVIEFKLVMNDMTNVNVLNSKIESGVSITRLYNSNDSSYSFIKEACLKLFGVYPKEIIKGGK